MSQELAARHGAWSDTPRPLAFVLQMMVVAEADVRKLLHDPAELFTRMLQPVLWLVIFAPVFSRVRAIPTGEFAISGLHGAGNSGAKRDVRRYFLRNLSDLGAGPGSPAQVHGESRAQGLAGDGPRAFLHHSRGISSGAGVHHRVRDGRAAAV